MSALLPTSRPRSAEPSPAATSIVASPAATSPHHLPRPPPAKTRRRRRHLPRQLLPSLSLPPPHCRPPMGLAAHPQPRRHHHGSEPGRPPHPAQPRTTACSLTLKRRS